MQDTIMDMKLRGITFSYISEEKATSIMETEYTASMLMRYSSLFECYHSTDKAGKFLDLDFAYLYDIALIDSELQKIIICLCMDMERSLKTAFISDCIRVGYRDKIVKDFVEEDYEYVAYFYNVHNLDAAAKRIMGDSRVDDLSLDDFLELITFGTFQRLSAFFYRKFAQELYGKPTAPFEQFLDSVRMLRNSAAHNNAIIAGIADPNSAEFRQNYLLSSYLGRHGIKNCTLKTNMSKQPIHDLSCLLHLYSIMVPCSVKQHSMSEFLRFLHERCTRHSEYYIKNAELISAYRFIEQVINVYLPCV